MIKENWVDITKLSDILGVLKETLRRNCLASKYIYKTQKAGKFKHYQVLVSSLPQEYQDKYNNFLIPNDKNIDFEIYSNAPEWARKQADKYLNLINQTAKMSHKQVKAFLSEWNTKNSNNTAATFLGRFKLSLTSILLTNSFSISSMSSKSYVGEMAT